MGLTRLTVSFLSKTIHALTLLRCWSYAKFQTTALLQRLKKAIPANFLKPDGGGLRFLQRRSGRQEPKYGESFLALKTLRRRSIRLLRTSMLGHRDRLYRSRF